MKKQKVREEIERRRQHTSWKASQLGHFLSSSESLAFAHRPRATLVTQTHGMLVHPHCPRPMFSLEMKPRF